MEMGNRLKHAFNVLMDKPPTSYHHDRGMSYSSRPDRTRMTRGNEKSIVTAIYNKIAVDVASINIMHCVVDDDGRYISNYSSGLNNCLNVEANIDQTGRALKQDLVMSMFDEGCIAVAPIDTNIDPTISNSYDILSLRVCKIIEWYPNSVRLRAYNDQTGQYDELIMSKKLVAIIENPLFAVVNEPNSTVQRLIRKLNLLDSIDEQSGSGKLDLIIQLPYTVRNELRKKQAEERRQDIESQLAGSKYGIAYTDGTEKVTQLNRPAENNLMKQIEYLTNMVYSQLGINQAILDGTASEEVMLNYYNRTIEPILAAIVDEMKRKFLTKTARTQKQTLMFFRDPFKLASMTNIAEIADKFTRNEIMSSNEIRQKIGMKPSSDPKADKLVNSNITQPGDGTESQPPSIYQNKEPITEMSEDEYVQSIKGLNDIDNNIDELESEFETDIGSQQITHYNSSYYDPAKAHEYYERTKELKGQKSTSKLNDEGKAAAKYVKDSINSEKKSKIDYEKSSYKAKLEEHKLDMTSKIDSLRAQLKNMSKEQKLEMKDEIYGMIDKLRADNKAMRDELASNFKEVSAKLKKDADNQYITELDKIRSTKSFKKVFKRKR